MSQKRLKRIKKAEVLKTVDKPIESFLGIRRIIKENWKFLLLLCLGTFLLYANSLNGDFVSDDYATIVQNSEIGSFRYAMTHETFFNSMNITNYFVNLLFGNTDSIFYHFASLVWFLLFLLIAFVLIFLVTRNSWVTILALTLFAVHPIHVEAVSWNAGRIYVIISFYVVFALVTFIRFVESGKRKYLWSTVGLFLLAFSTDRPRPFSFFLLIIIYLLSFASRESVKKLFKWAWFFLLILTVGLIISLPYIWRRIEAVNGGVNVSESIFYSPLFQYPTGIGKYLQLLTFPIDLTLYHTLFVFPSWLNWSILLIFLVALFYFYFKNKHLFFGLAFFLAGLAPSIAPVKVSWLVAERYVFLGSLGICLFLSWLIYFLFKKNRYLAIILSVLVILIYSIRLILRNIDWRTNHKLWVNTCQVSPNSHNAWNNIGDDYDKLKQYDNAIRGFTRSVLVKPNYADAYHNRANILFKIGRLDLARESYQTALSFNSTMFQTYLSLTQIDLMENRGDKALEDAQKVVQLQPNNPQAVYVLAVVYARLGRLNEARDILKKILSVYPDYKQAIDILKEIENLKAGSSLNN